MVEEKEPDSAVEKPTLSSLLDPVDISQELVPLIMNLKNTEEKESWKIRQEAVMQVMELVSKKALLANTPMIGETLAVLKSRFVETNLNLRAKMIQAVGQLASKIHQGVGSYTNMVIPDLLKYSADSNRGVVDATVTTLTTWIHHDEHKDVQIVSQVLVHMPLALKAIKSRQVLLPWIKEHATGCDGTALTPLIGGVLDGMLDKTKESRSVAQDLLEVLLEKCGVEAVMRGTEQRKPIDTAQLKSIIQALSTSQVNETPIQEKEEKEESLPDPAEEQQRRQALAQRRGVRVLSKPKVGPDGKPLPKFSVKSSIPKPMPRKVHQPKLLFAPKQELQPKLEIETEIETETEPIHLNPMDIPNSIPLNETALNEIPSPIESVADSVHEEPHPALVLKSSQKPLQSSVYSSSLKAVSLGIPLNPQELLFEEELVESGSRNNRGNLTVVIVPNGTAFSKSFVQAIELWDIPRISQAINGIVKSCTPVSSSFPVEVDLPC